MARKPSGKPTGRPQKEINWDQFEQLCALQCTQSEIANMLKVHPNTISDRVIEHYGEDYSTIYNRFQESGKCSLRRNQFVLSKTNAGMAIWLGKQWLGQKDTDQHVLLAPNDKQLELEDKLIRLEQRNLNLEHQNSKLLEKVTLLENHTVKKHFISDDKDEHKPATSSELLRSE